MHPEPNGEWPVVRFTAPVAGYYRSTGRFWAQNVSSTGTETDTMVAHNASLIVPPMTLRGLPPTPRNHPFHRGLNLHPGDTIDFMVEARGNCQNDSTDLHGNIQRDEP